MITISNRITGSSRTLIVMVKEWIMIFFFLLNGWLISIILAYCVGSIFKQVLGCLHSLLMLRLCIFLFLFFKNIASSLFVLICHTLKLLLLHFICEVRLRHVSSLCLVLRMIKRLLLLFLGLWLRLGLWEIVKDIAIIVLLIVSILVDSIILLINRVIRPARTPTSNQYICGNNWIFLRLNIRRHCSLLLLALLFHDLLILIVHKVWRGTARISIIRLLMVIILIHLSCWCFLCTNLFGSWLLVLRILLPSKTSKISSKIVNASAVLYLDIVVIWWYSFLFLYYSKKRWSCTHWFRVISISRILRLFRRGCVR